jgi:DNA-binding NtrC family response regulator
LISRGVGKLLNFANEGLGLALAIKNKYPKKKVVIYSAQTSGDRFNEALRKADDFLAKNAEPYEFITVVERLAEDL